MVLDGKHVGIILQRDDIQAILDISWENAGLYRKYLENCGMFFLQHLEKYGIMSDIWEISGRQMGYMGYMLEKCRMT